MKVRRERGDRIQSAQCPSCKRQLVWSDVNQQWYCGKCELYYQPGGNVPRDSLSHLADEVRDIFNPKPQPQVYYCSNCSTPLNWIPQYGRWYCYTCRIYV